jgi:hypothetical protein
MQAVVGIAVEDGLDDANGEAGSAVVGTIIKT